MAAQLESMNTVETMDSEVAASETAADISEAELASEVDSGDKEDRSIDEDIDLKRALEFQSIPVASPMRCGLAKRGLGAIYSSTVSAPKQLLSPTRGVRNLASLLRSSNTMSGDDIVRLHQEAGPEAPELARARARANRGRSTLAKVSAEVSERRMHVAQEAARKQEQTVDQKQSQPQPATEADPVQESSEQGRSSPKSRSRAQRCAVSSKASPEAEAVVQEKDEMSVDLKTQESAADVEVELHSKQDEAKSPRTSKGSSKGSSSKSSKVMKRPAGRQSFNGNTEQAPVEEAAEEHQEPPTKKAKIDPEVAHFLSLGEKQREKHMMSLSFAKQSKLAMKISLAEEL